MAPATQQQRTTDKDSKTASADKTVILCPRLTKGSGVLEAICALQYLPQSYTLLLGAVKQESESFYKRARTLAEQTPALNGRVVFGRSVTTEQPTDEPTLFSNADIVMYSSLEPAQSEAANCSIIVFDIASTERQEEHNVTVSAKKPEALASAILRVVSNRRAVAVAA